MLFGGCWFFVLFCVCFFLDSLRLTSSLVVPFLGDCDNPVARACRKKISMPVIDTFQFVTDRRTTASSPVSLSTVGIWAYWLFDVYTLQKKWTRRFWCALRSSQGDTARSWGVSLVVEDLKWLDAKGCRFPIFRLRMRYLDCVVGTTLCNVFFLGAGVQELSVFKTANDKRSNSPEVLCG